MRLLTTMKDQALTIAIGLLVFSVPLGILLVQWRALTTARGVASTIWRGYLYSSLNHGLDPVFVAEFASEAQCKGAIADRVGTPAAIDGTYPVDGYFCGRGCHWDSAPGPGGFLLQEGECQDTYFSRPLPP